MKRLAILVCLLAIPTFSLMLKSGIYTMHDFHAFRQFEFNKCMQEGAFPCRFAPDAGMGYGEPVFNFYGQTPYWLGHLVHMAGFQIIDSVKILFILSLVLSGITMYIFAREYWGKAGGLISAIFYLYAPYRAVDVWVRGALPEAFGFVFFPLILFFIKTRQWLLLAVSFGLLISTHNLSAYMFLPFMGIYWLIESRSIKVIWAGLVSLLLSAFYLLPVIWENHLVTVTKTTQDYFGFQLHWATLFQLFISRFWGYGGSGWGPNDTLSLSVGHLHWILPLIIVALVMLNAVKHPEKSWILRFTQNDKIVFLFLILGFFAAFLTHGKSEILWKIIPGMAFVQFPWRFLSVSTLFFSLAAGSLALVLPKKLFPLVIIIVISFYGGFFKPDIWRNISDTEQFSGKLWDEQRSSALQDFWPVTSPNLPTSFAPDNPEIVTGEGSAVTVHKGAHTSEYKLVINSPTALVRLPSVYFPGWQGEIDGNKVILFPNGDLGQVSFDVPQGEHVLNLDFKNTPARTWGNIISAVSLAAIVCKKLFLS